MDKMSDERDAAMTEAWAEYADNTGRYDRWENPNLEFAFAFGAGYDAGLQAHADQSRGAGGCEKSRCQCPEGVCRGPGEVGSGEYCASQFKPTDPTAAEPAGDYCTVHHSLDCWDCKLAQHAAAQVKAECVECERRAEELDKLTQQLEKAEEYIEQLKGEK